MRVALIHNEPIKGSPDSEDVLDQVKLVTDALEAMGASYEIMPLSISASDENSAASRSFSLIEAEFTLLRKLKKYNPDVVVNLVEAVPESVVFQHHIVLLLERFKYNFTGSGYEAMLTTSDKVLSKRLMQAFGIPTPEWQAYVGGRVPDITIPGPWLVKPALEDASLGIDDNSVFSDKGRLRKALPEIYQRLGRQCLLIERFIEGREFNVAVLEAPGGVEVLPLAEMTFVDWPKEKPRIVGYSAKWHRGSFEEVNTVRSFDPAGAPSDEIRSVSLKCWNAFKLSGYGRVDIRLDAEGRVYVLEINANPCISPDSGYIAAIKQSGRSEQEFVTAMLEAASN